ncbi:hypothetical protein Q1695_013146 [Nippostrongylus brasiliensis]|nr:hypothetical protein Q1695_013146 [Nippostrongylus brasiliensis]
MREKRLRDDLLFGPAMRRRLHEYMKRNYRVDKNGSYKVDDIDFFAHGEITDPQSDVLRQCSVSIFYRDVNYEKESSALRDSLMSKLSVPSFPTSSCRHKLEVTLPNTSHAIAIGDGGLSEVLWNDKTHSILIDIALDQDIREYVKWYFKKAVDAVRLTTTERLTLSKYLDSDGEERFENAVRVYFNSWKDCEKALADKDHRTARLFPRAFTIGKADWNSLKNVTMTYRAKWFAEPSMKTGFVRIKNSLYQEFTKKVLFDHNYFCEFKKDYDVDNTWIEVSCVPECFQDDASFEAHIRNILDENGVLLNRAFLNRRTRGMYDINEVVRGTVYRAIVNELIRSRQWHQRFPVSARDWRELMSGTLPWTWKILPGEEDDEEGKPREAELIFKDVECGLHMMELLTMDEKELNVSPGGEPSQRVIMKPVYCIGVAVTKEVRVACDPFIKRLNKEESAAAARAHCPLQSLNIVDKTWTEDYYAFDDFDNSEGEISVQGWPPTHVEEVALRLISYFAGSYIDCSDEKRGRLLYGYGARYVDFVREKLRGEVVIDVDLLRERITLVGERADLARRKLLYFADFSSSFLLTTRIAIMPPRFLHFMRNAILRVGLSKIREICGGKAEVTTEGTYHLKFHGTLQEYDLLMNFLEDLDERLVSAYSTQHTSLKPNCPVCLSRVSNAFYCLDCGHYYCLKCIIYQVKTLIRNRDLPIRCLHADCGKLFSTKDLECLVLGDARLPWLNAEKIKPLLISSIDYMLLKDSSLIRCPTADCLAIFSVEELSKKSVLKCEACKHSRCTSCMMEPHEGVSCEVYANLRTDEAASLRAYLEQHQGKVRECPAPGCGALIEKEEGCNHVKCSVCGVHFCWTCGFMDEAQSKVYGHLRDEHGAIGDEWPLFDNFPMGFQRRHHRREDFFVDPLLEHFDDDIAFPLVNLQ